MKYCSKAFFLLLVITFPLWALSEHYRPMRIEVGGIVPFVFPDSVSAGFGFLVEPKLNITDKFSTGIRFETGVTTKSFGFAAATLKGEYFFTTNMVRPFLGIGGGVWAVTGEESGDFSDDIIESRTEFIRGIVPGISANSGINIGLFRFAVNYHLIFAQEETASINLDKAIVEYGNRTVRPRSLICFELSCSILGNKK